MNNPAKLNEKYGTRGWHCDDLWADKKLPDCVLKYLDCFRAPATEQLKIEPKPKLFATHNGKRVRVVMASRFGDVGITDNLTAEHGYSARVFLPDLQDFSAEP